MHKNTTTTKHDGVTNVKAPQSHRTRTCCFADTRRRRLLLCLQHVCQLSGWKPGSRHFVHAHELFIDVWRNLQDSADENTDGVITEDEWVQTSSSFELETNFYASLQSQNPSYQRGGGFCSITQLFAQPNVSKSCVIAHEPFLYRVRILTEVRSFRSTL